MEIPQLPAAEQQPSQSSVAQRTLADNFDQFLRMLTTQLKNQDPLSPMDSTEFTNQLVMFSQLEQQINQNSKLEQMIALQQAAESTAALNYLGNTIKAKSAANFLEGGSMSFAYDMPAGAAKATVTIFDAAGNVVTQFPGETAKGHHGHTWNGRNGQDVLQPDGPYSVLVSATGDDDAPLSPIAVYMQGLASGVTQEDGVTYLQVGPIDVPLDTVVGVSRPTSDTTS